MSPPPCDGTDTCVVHRRTFPAENGDSHEESDHSRSESGNSQKKPLLSSSSFTSLLCLDSNSENDVDKIRRIITASAKAFAIGAGIKGGLSLFSILSRLRRRRKTPITATTRNGDTTIEALKETLRYGLFLGTFAGTFVSVDELLAALGGNRRTAGWRAVLAGAIAGPSILLTGPNTQHTSLAIYILMRAAVLASRCGIKSKRFGRICKPLTWSHGDIFLMCLSSSQILSAYILNQNALPPSYKSFLNKHGGKPLIILQGVKEIASGLPLNSLEGIQKHYKSMDMDVKLDPQMKVPCSIIHGHQSCGSHFLSFLFQAYGRALPVYLPIYLIPALIVHRQGLLKRGMVLLTWFSCGHISSRDYFADVSLFLVDFSTWLTSLFFADVSYISCYPLSTWSYTILGKVLLGTSRSSLFLSTYCASAWMWTCLLFRSANKCSIPLVALGTFPTGLSLAIEKKSRRIEIALYCFARAIESFFACMEDVGLLPESKKLKRADVVIFSLSTAIIMHCYAREREVFRSKYLNVLDWVFGVPPSTCDSPNEKCDKINACDKDDNRSSW